MEIRSGERVVEEGFGPAAGENGRRDRHVQWGTMGGRGGAGELAEKLFDLVAMISGKDDADEAIGEGSLVMR